MRRSVELSRALAMDRGELIAPAADAIAESEEEAAELIYEAEMQRAFAAAKARR